MKRTFAHYKHWITSALILFILDGWFTSAIAAESSSLGLLSSSRQKNAVSRKPFPASPPVDWQKTVAVVHNPNLFPVTCRVVGVSGQDLEIPAGWQEWLPVASFPARLEYSAPPLLMAIYQAPPDIEIRHAGQSVSLALHLNEERWGTLERMDAADFRGDSSDALIAELGFWDTWFAIKTVYAALAKNAVILEGAGGPSAFDCSILLETLDDLYSLRQLTVHLRTMDAVHLDWFPDAIYQSEWFSKEHSREIAEFTENNRISGMLQHVTDTILEHVRLAIWNESECSHKLGAIIEQWPDFDLGNRSEP